MGGRLHGMPVEALSPRLSVTARCLAAILLVAGGCGTKPDRQSLEDALRRQSAGVVESSTGEFRIGKTTSSCVRRPRVAETLLLDPATGLPRWRRAIPWAPDGAVAVGDTVVAVGSSIDVYPPSVVALDLETGERRWQRFFASPVLYLIGSAGRTAVVQRPDGLSAIDVTSGETVWEKPLENARLVQRWWSGGALLPPSGPFAVFERDDELIVVELASGVMRLLPGASQAVVDDGGLLVVRGAVVEGYSSLTDPTPRWTSAPLPFDDMFNGSAHLSSAAGAILALVGSKRGIDHRLVVLDAETGTVRWTVDGARSATIANGVLVLARRAVRDRSLVTELVGRRLDNGDEMWTTENWGGLNGYLGTTERGGVFGFAGAEWPNVERLARLDPRTGNGSAGPEVGPPDETPTAAPPALVSEELVLVRPAPVFMDPQSIHAYDGVALERRWSAPFPDRTLHASMTPRGLLVTAASPRISCR